MPRRAQLLDDIERPLVTIDHLVYDPAAHVTTVRGSGRSVPHVTSVLDAVGVTTDFDEISSWGPRYAQRMDVARQLGTAVHEDCHAYDDDELQWDLVHEAVLPRLKAWAQVRRDKRLEPVPHGRERQVFDPVRFYTGILDGVFLCHSGPRVKRVLADIKNGDPESAAAHLQTAAYERAWNAQRPDELIDERWAVQLCPGRRVPYRILNYSARPDAWADFPKFEACLCVYNEQPARRAKIKC